MNAGFIMDSSAVIAYILEESGQDIAAFYLEEKSIISTVNFSEILSFGLRRDSANKISKSALLDIIPLVSDFTIEQASLAAELIQETHKYGLSFADRACLALGKAMKLPVVTADKIWKELDIGIEIILIR